MGNAAVATASSLPSAGFGGAVAVGLGLALLTVSQCSFSGNTASVSGGAANVAYAGRVAISNCSFTGNSATSGGGCDDPKNPSSEVPPIHSLPGLIVQVLSCWV